MPQSRSRLPKCLIHLLVVGALLVTQTVGIGFCGGVPTDAHSATSHFHVALLLEPSPSCGHCHHLDDVAEGPNLAETVPDHDADAVYVSADTGLRAKAGLDPLPESVVWSSELVDPLSRNPIGHWAAPSPGHAPPTCPIYLRHLALLL